MPLGPSLEGNRAFQQASDYVNGVPPASFVGSLGQTVFDKTQTPPVGYVYNGQTWVNAVYTNVVTVSGAAAATLTANGRAISVTFTGPSIAAGATQAFTILDTAITAASLLDITMVGSTSGAAPTIQSVANTAGQSVITVTNGTGATTQTGNLTFTILVLN